MATKLTDEAKKIGALAIVLSIIAVVGSIASIVSGFGTWGVAVSIGLTLALFVLCYLILRPVLAKTSRGVTLLEAITSVGLIDIENRDDRSRGLPPTEFLNLAEHEIAITGLSAYRTFDQHVDVIHKLLENGRNVYMLILAPDSEAARRLVVPERKDVAADIISVITVIKREGLHKHPGFHIRFLQERPPYTAVMVDGDLVQTGRTPRDHRGQIRIQPVTVHGTHHAGIILQLKKTVGDLKGPFDQFAEDLRRQWAFDGKDRNELFA